MCSPHGSNGCRDLSLVPQGFHRHTQLSSLRFLVELFQDNIRHDNSVRQDYLMPLVGAERRCSQIDHLNLTGKRSHGDLVTPFEGAFYHKVQASNEILGHILQRQTDGQAERTYQGR